MELNLTAVHGTLGARYAERSSIQWSVNTYVNSVEQLINPLHQEHTSAQHVPMKEEKKPENGAITGKKSGVLGCLEVLIYAPSAEVSTLLQVENKSIAQLVQSALGQNIIERTP